MSFFSLCGASSFLGRILPSLLAGLQLPSLLEPQPTFIPHRILLDLLFSENSFPIFSSCFCYHHASTFFPSLSRKNPARFFFPPGYVFVLCPHLMSYLFLRAKLFRQICVFPRALTTSPSYPHISTSLLSLGLASTRRLTYSMEVHLQNRGG